MLSIAGLFSNISTNVYLGIYINMYTLMSKKNKNYEYNIQWVNVDLGETKKEY